jgi:hypothetical protein
MEQPHEELQILEDIKNSRVDKTAKLNGYGNWVFFIHRPVYNGNNARRKEQVPPFEQSGPSGHEKRK